MCDRCANMQIVSLWYQTAVNCEFNREIKNFACRINAFGWLKSCKFIRWPQAMHIDFQRDMKHKNVRKNDNI